MRALNMGILATGIALASQASAQELIRGPYLQNLKQDSVEIFWSTDVEAETWAAVREKGESDPPAVYMSNVPATRHRQAVARLEVDTWYEYRIGRGEEDFLHDEWIPFQTLPPDDVEVYEFVLYGDHRNFPQHHRAVVDAMIERAEERGWPRFVIDSGDLTGQGEGVIDPWDEQFFEPAQPLIRRVNLFPAIGNHESRIHWPRIPIRYFENFSVPTENSGSKYYYSFQVGVVKVIVMDSWSSDWRRGSKQWHWVVRELRESEATWNVVVFHHPMYSYRAAPNPYPGDLEMREHLDPIFRELGASIVMTGHNHFYQRVEASGIHHITSGGGGAPLYTPVLPGEGEETVKAAAETHHYVWFRVAGDEMTLWAWDDQNELIETAILRPRRTEEIGPELNFTRHLPGDDMTPGNMYIVESRDADGNLTPEPLYSEVGNMTSSSVKSSVPELVGQGTRYADAGQAGTQFSFQPPIEEAGTYLLSVTTPGAGSVGAPYSLFEVTQGDAPLIRGQVRLHYDTTGHRWHDIGLFDLVPGDTVTFTQSDFEPDRFYADAIKVTRYQGSEE